MVEKTVIHQDEYLSCEACVEMYPNPSLFTMIREISNQNWCRHGKCCADTTINFREEQA